MAQQIRKALGTDLLQLLFQVIPLLQVVTEDSDDIPQQPTQEQAPTMSLQSPEAQKNQIHYAFAKFVRIVAAAFCPMVLVLDDLQWADAASLDLLDFIMRDNAATASGTSQESSSTTQQQNILIVGIYRSTNPENLTASKNDPESARTDNTFHRFLRGLQESSNNQKDRAFFSPYKSIIGYLIKSASYDISIT